MFWESSRVRNTKAPKRQLHRRRKIRFTLVSLCLFLVLLFWKPIVAQMRPLFLDLVLYTYALVEKPVHDVNLMIQDVRRHLYLQKNASILSDLISEMRTLRTQNANLKQKNEVLEQQLNLVESSSKDMVYASVFGHSSLKHNKVIFLRAGASQGVHRSDVLISEGSPVGIVFETGLNFSKAYALTSGEMRVPVYFSGTIKEGILVGTGSLNELIVKYVERPQDISVGAKVFSSGTGGIYPRDMLLGYVQEIRDKTVIVKSAVHFESINYVGIFHPEHGNAFDQFSRVNAE